MILFEINQAILKGGQRLPLSVVKQVLKTVDNQLNLRGKKRVSIGFVSPSQIRKLNKQYRGKDKVTDVLSFQLASGDMIGEVLISYDQARRQAKIIGHSIRKEVQFLLVHGLLHLFGYDHEKESDAKKMFLIQDRILKTLHINPTL